MSNAVSYARVSTREQNPAAQESGQYARRSQKEAERLSAEGSLEDQARCSIVRC